MLESIKMQVIAFAATLLLGFVCGRWRRRMKTLGVAAKETGEALSAAADVPKAFVKACADRKLTRDEAQDLWREMKEAKEEVGEAFDAIVDVFKKKRAP